MSDDSEMCTNNQHNFSTTELDPDLLSTPFRLQTNWHVITGAPSCGKTTLINLLADKGFQTVPESARQFMEREIARGRTINEIHANGAALQRDIEDMQLGVERRLRASDVIFLDGAVPGSLAWYRVFGLNPNDVLPGCFHHRYASIFILDRLPLQQDGLRFDDHAYNNFLDEWHTRDYLALGYNIVRVPVLAPEERLAFVLEELFKRGLMQ